MKGSKNSRLPPCPYDEVNEYTYLYPGEYYFATNPTLIYTVLGSCVSVVLFDEILKYGAMCHAVLDTNYDRNSSGNSFRYMDCVLDEMIRRFAEHRIPMKRLVAKIFGGACLVTKQNASSSYIGPGHRNICMAKKILHEHGFKVAAEDLGGTQGRKIYFYSHTGDVFLKKIKI
jgi:chemotaxis protein CheD